MSFCCRALTVLLAVGLSASAYARQLPLSTAFTYQGELRAAGVPTAGTFDVRFRLYDAAISGTQVGPEVCLNDLPIANGRFAANLDFGAVFAGQQRFLEIDVRADVGGDCADPSGYDTLTPRQALTATPAAAFSLTSGSATTAGNASQLNGQSAAFFTNAANLTGTLPTAALPTTVARLDQNQTFTGQIAFSNPANTFSGTFTGNGAGLTNLSGSSINPGTLTRSSLTADVQSGLGTLVPDLSLAGSVATGFTPKSVAVSGSFAYVVNQLSNTLQVFSISNSGAPTLAGSIATGSQPISVEVSGSFAYVVNVGSNTLQVFNVSNPAAPTLAASVATSQPQSVVVSDSFAYVVSSFAFTSTLQVFNISNPAAPALVGSIAIGTNGLEVAVSGSFAYVATGLNAVRIFNISNPAAPTLAGSISTPDFLSGVAVSGSFAYVASLPNTLQVFNISNPAAPTLAASVATAARPSSLAVSGSLAYVTNFDSNTLQVFRTNGVNFGTPLASSSLTGVNGSGLTGVNAAQLNGQTASFYTNASNIAIGTLADARLSPNIALKNAANVFTSTGVTSFAGNLGIGTTTPSSQFSLEAVSAGATQIALTGGPATGGAIPPRTWSIQSTDVIGPLNQITGSFQIVDRTAIAARLLIDTNGNVGIGTTAPSQRLSVAGNMNVTGSLSKGGGSFKIDHPLDPENKYLYHSFVESPDMMNVYNGNVVTDADGYATITLPDYFEALNRDFRYQLTVIDESDDMDVFLWAKVVREVKDNQFTLRSSRGNLKVSWQVTGVRQGAWANKNRIPNAVPKPESERGRYLHPEAFGKPADRGIHAAPDARQPAPKAIDTPTVAPVGSSTAAP